MKVGKTIYAKYYARSIRLYTPKYKKSLQTLRLQGFTII